MGAGETVCVFYKAQSQNIFGENCVGLQRRVSNGCCGQTAKRGVVLGLDTHGQIEKSLQKLVAKALNKNQILILNKIKENKNKTITGLLESIRKSEGIPLSTLKLNAKVLSDLSLISFAKGETVRTTPSGNIVSNLSGGFL